MCKIALKNAFTSSSCGLLKSENELASLVPGLVAKLATKALFAIDVFFGLNYKIIVFESK